MNPLIYHYEYEWSFTTIVCFEDRFEFVVVVVLFGITWAGKWCHKKKDLWFVQVTNTVFTRYILDKIGIQ